MMEALFTLLFLGCPASLFALGIAIGWYFLGGKDTIAANQFKAKVRSLNPLKGKARGEIEAVLGPPSSWFAAGGDRISCTWALRKYHISLVFDGDVCEGVTDEINL